MTANNPAWLNEPLLGLLGGKLSSTEVGREIAYESAAEPKVYIIFNKNRVPSSGDLDFIASVLNRRSEYIGKATDFLVQEENPNNSVSLPAMLKALSPRLPLVGPVSHSGWTAAGV